MAKTEKPKAKSKSRTSKPPQKKSHKKSTLHGDIVFVSHREEKERYLWYYVRLPVQKYAAAAIGYTADTIQNWLKEDSAFSAQCQAAKAAFVMAQVGKIRNPEWLLERLMRDTFGEKEEKKTDENLNKELEAALDRMASILPKAGA